MQNHQVVEELEEVVVVGEVEEVDDLLVGEDLEEEVVLEVVVEDLEEVDVGVVEDLEVEEMAGFLKDGVVMIEWAMMKAMVGHMVEEEEEVVVQGEVHHPVDNHVEDMVMLTLEGEVAMEIVVMIDMMMAMGVIMVMITMEKVVEEVVVVMEVVEVEVVVVDHIVISTITYKMW